MTCRTFASVLALLLAPGVAAAAPGMLGFSPASAEAERAVETRFDAALSAPAIDARLKTLSAAPNEVGSPHDKANAAQNLDEVHKLIDTLRERSATTDRLLGENAFDLAADPTKPSAPPPRDDAVPGLDFAPLDGAVARLKASAAAYDTALASASALSPETRARLDGVLMSVEHSLTDPRGLPGRPWYQHLIYAPGLLTGYGAKTLPGVREAIEGRRWAEAQDFIVRTAAALDAATARIDAATAIVNGG
jgi:hypothetical protein